MNYAGNPYDMPQQQMYLPPVPVKNEEMVIDLLGIRIPATMLETGTFWIFMVLVIAAVIAVAWLKYGGKK